MARVFGATVVAGSLLLGAFSACASSQDNPAGGTAAPAPGPALEESNVGNVSAQDWKLPQAGLLPASALTKTWLERAQRWAQVDRLLSRVLASNDTAWLSDGPLQTSQLNSSAYRLTAGAQSDALFVTTGIAARSPVEVSLAPGSGLGFALARQGARDVPGQLERGRLVFADAFRATDVVLAATASQVEELLILKDAGAPRAFSWEVTLGSELSDLVKQPDGSLLARALDGPAALRVRPARLIDSYGQSRPVDLHWDKPRLTLRIDAHGLTYPLLLDPMIESALWESAPSAGGTARVSHAAARLAAGGLIYGGENPDDGVLATTQRYTGGTWSPLSPATSPGPLRNHAMAFDGTNIVMFGGHSGAAHQGKTWVWTGSDWSERCTVGMPCASAPTARQGMAMAFAGAGKVLIFGGGVAPSSALVDETWEFAAGTWTAKCTACVSGTSKPSARSFSAMAYAGGSSVLLFGGIAGGENDQTWLWNGTSWSQVCTGCVTGSSKPSARGRQSMVWDEHRQKVLLFGGRDVNGQLFDETWEWDSGNDEWLLTASSGPVERMHAAMFYDMTSKRVVLFGGTDNVNPPLADTWLYHARGGDCTDAGDCNTGFCKDGKCCETACDADCRTCAGANWGLCGNVASAEDSDTCHTTETCSAAGVCKLQQGETCSLANGSECITANCVDGRCCESTCTAACKSCGNATGSCSNLTQFSTDTSPVCSGNNSCDGNGACKENNGQTCSSAGECTSGYCVDGRCCESDCTTPCKSCGNATGTCTTNVAKGSADSNASPACTGAGACDGAGTCKKSNGQNCPGGVSDCASNFCADGKCCDTACTGECNECSDGSCSVRAAASPGDPSCSPYACNGSSADCPTSCANDNSCASDHYCNASNVCAPDEAVGTACTRNQQCQGNQHCVDGFCCNEACGGACKGCSNATKGVGADGSCGDIVSGGAPRAPGCSVGGPCLADGKCNGTGACRAFAPNTTACGAGTVCVGNSVSGQLCDGTGVCGAAGGSQDCAPAKCAGGVCTTSCTGDADCDPATGFCAGSVCATKLDDGESCSGSNECAGSNCVDGICCNNACAGDCQTCATGVCRVREAGSEGGPSCAPFVCDGTSPNCPDDCTNDDVCILTHYCKVSDNTCEPRVNGTPCTADDQCPEPFCVDGVCCTTACDGQCEQCDATGECVTTTGAPAGTRDPCPGHADCAGSCDGTNREACTDAKEVGTACGTPSCSANIAAASSCDADAACVEVEAACDPFVCGDTTCKTTCEEDQDCQPGFSCANGDCISSDGGVCNDEGTQLTSPDDTVTDCAPYICSAGECLRNCTSSTECQSGNACNTERGDGVCEPTTTGDTGADDAGCGCRQVGANGSPRGTLLGLMIVGLLALRRRQRLSTIREPVLR